MNILDVMSFAISTWTILDVQERKQLQIVIDNVEFDP